LLKGSRRTNLYTISIDDMMKCSPICLLSKASKFTWVKFLRSKDETPEFVTNFLKEIQNRSLIHTRHNKTPYELVHDKKPDLTFFRVFGALCYPTNDSENLEKFQAKTDIGIFVGYAPSRKGYRIYNKRTHRLMETIHVTFDEMHQSMAPTRIIPSAIEFNAQVVPPGTSLSTTITQDAPSTSDSSSTSDIHLPVQHQEIAEEPIQEDTPIIHDVLHPSHNLVTGDPGSAQLGDRTGPETDPDQTDPDLTVSSLVHCFG
ncbi:retrovirus-related pol polyprotein from transposon TNT 1-94, partial [Tanacetum coccineum]